MSAWMEGRISCSMLHELDAANNTNESTTKPKHHNKTLDTYYTKLQQLQTNEQNIATIDLDNNSKTQQLDNSINYLTQTELAIGPKTNTSLQTNNSVSF